MYINLTCNIFERSTFIFNGCFLKNRTMISIAIYPYCKWHILSVLSKQIHNAFDWIILDHTVNQHWNVIYQYPFPVSFSKIISLWNYDYIKKKICHYLSKVMPDIALSHLWICKILKKFLKSDLHVTWPFLKRIINVQIRQRCIFWKL